MATTTKVDPQPGSEPQHPGTAFAYERMLAPFVAMLATALVFGVLVRFQPISGANDGSRWDTVWALLNGKGYIIDEAPFNTIDKVRRDGHFYSSKPPLMPTVLAGPAWVLQALFGWSLPYQAHFVVKTILLLVNIIPLALFIVYFGRLIERWQPDPFTRLFALASAAFGTYLTAYSITLNNHTQAALAAFFALYCLIRIQCDGRREWHYFALCALFVSWAVANEMVAAVFAVLVMGYLLKDHFRLTLRYFVPVAAVMGAAYFYTTWVSTGGLLPYYMYFNTDYYQYEGSYWRNPRGIDAASDPKWLYAFHVLFGHHGVFSLTPIFLLSMYGMWKDRTLRPLHWMGLGLSAVMTVFYIFKTNNYGGVCQGARWLFWLIPFWLIGLVPALRAHSESRRFRIFALAALFLSLMAVGHALGGHRDMGRPGPWSASWIHLLMRHLGWVDY